MLFLLQYLTQLQTHERHLVVRRIRTSGDYCVSLNTYSAPHQPLPSFYFWGPPFLRETLYWIGWEYSFQSLILQMTGCMTWARFRSSLFLRLIYEIRKNTLASCACEEDKLGLSPLLRAQGRWPSLQNLVSSPESCVF